jgi:sugar transferase (PEP-CTERM/EpsH1 system associated)
MVLLSTDALADRPVQAGSRSPLTVAHVVLSLDCGGLERIVLDLLRTSRRRGQRAAVVCLERPGALAGRVEELEVQLVCIHKRPGLDWNAAGRAGEVLRRIGPDVVHTHQAGALWYVGGAARRAGIPVIHTEHGNHLGRTGSWLARWRRSWLWWLAGRHARKFICVSAEIARELTARRIVPQDKVCVLPNGIDTDKFSARADAVGVRRSLGIAPQAPVVGTVGRLSEVKRQDLLLQGFARLKQRLPEARLLLVGDGPMRGPLEQLASELRLRDSVHFAGFQEEPAAYLQAMDVFALSSRSEGLPVSILEAWAAGLPVVSSAVGGVPEIIEQGRTGLLYPSGDAGSLAGRLGEVLSDQNLARTLAGAGQREVAARYSLDRMVDDYQRHYQAVLA